MRSIVQKLSFPGRTTSSAPSRRPLTQLEVHAEQYHYTETSYKKPSSYISHDEAKLEEDAMKLADFISPKRSLVAITGAGISTDSGLPDYRGPDGAYSKGHKPMTFQEFMANDLRRKRYWARSMRAWPYFSIIEPNKTHLAVASLQLAHRVGRVITQNVDRLHHKAGSYHVTELHGSMAEVQCMKCTTIWPRPIIQRDLEETNPDWVVKQSEEAKAFFRPDGDVEIAGKPAAESYESFILPRCPGCPDGGLLKPHVVFFGENVPPKVTKEAFDAVENADGLLVLGTSLSVMSSYRFILKATERRIPIAIVNLGQTRGDPQAILKIDHSAAEVLSRTLRKLDLVAEGRTRESDGGFNKLVPVCPRLLLSSHLSAHSRGRLALALALTSKSQSRLWKRMASSLLTKGADGSFLPAATDLLFRLFARLPVIFDLNNEAHREKVLSVVDSISYAHHATELLVPLVEFFLLQLAPPSTAVAPPKDSSEIDMNSGVIRSSLKPAKSTQVDASSAPPASPRLFSSLSALSLLSSSYPVFQSLALPVLRYYMNSYNPPLVRYEAMNGLGRQLRSLEGQMGVEPMTKLCLDALLPASELNSTPLKAVETHFIALDTLRFLLDPAIPVPPQVPSRAFESSIASLRYKDRGPAQSEVIDKRFAVKVLAALVRLNQFKWNLEVLPELKHILGTSLAPLPLKCAALRALGVFLVHEDSLSTSIRDFLIKVIFMEPPLSSTVTPIELFKVCEAASRATLSGLTIHSHHQCTSSSYTQCLISTHLHNKSNSDSVSAATRLAYRALHAELFLAPKQRRGLKAGFKVPRLEETFSFEWPEAGPSPPSSNSDTKGSGSAGTFSPEFSSPLPSDINVSTLTQSKLIQALFAKSISNPNSDFNPHPTPNSNPHSNSDHYPHPAMNPATKLPPNSNPTPDSHLASERGLAEPQVINLISSFPTLAASALGCAILEMRLEGRVVTPPPPEAIVAVQSKAKTQSGEKDLKRKAEADLKGHVWKRQKKNEICRFYFMRQCTAGDACPFLHEGPQVVFQEICKFFRSGWCQKGAQCPFSHDLTQEACLHLVKGEECPFERRPGGCRFSHRPDIVARAKLAGPPEKPS